MSFGVLCDWTYLSDKLRQNGAHLNLDIYLSIFVNLIYALRLCRGIWVNDDLSFRLRCLFWRKEEEVMVVCNSQPQCLAGHVCGWLYASERVSSFRPPLSQQRCRVHPQSQSFLFSGRFNVIGNCLLRMFFFSDYLPKSSFILQKNLICCRPC